MSDHQRYERQCAVIEGILLAFDKQLKYDYEIPNANEVRELVQKYLKSKSRKTKLLKEVEEVINRWDRDSYSVLEDHIRLANFQFGSEWFYGYGDFYRWRPGEKEKAQERVKKLLTKSEQKQLAELQEAIKIRKVGKAFGKMTANVGSV